MKGKTEMKQSHTQYHGNGICKTKQEICLDLFMYATLITHVCMSFGYIV